MFECVYDCIPIEPITRRQILDFSKLKELADVNFKFDENGKKLSEHVETLWEKEKLLGTSNFSFSHSVFLTLSQTTNFRLFQTERVCRRQFQI